MRFGKKMPHLPAQRQVVLRFERRLIGDFRVEPTKLRKVHQDLGVNTLWLMPFILAAARRRLRHCGIT